MSTQSRSKEEPYDDSIVEMNRPDGYNSPKWVVDPQDSYLSYYEEYTPNSEGSHSRWKSFQHYKRWSDVRPSGQGIPFAAECSATNDWLWLGNTRFPYSLYGDEFGVQGKLDKDLPAFYVIQPDGVFVPPPAELDSLVSSSLTTMLPKIKAELSIVNSIIELKDFRSLVTMTRSAIGRIRRFGFSWLKPHLTLRNALRQAPGGYLQYMFNFRPLVSDIAAIHRSLISTEKRINDLVTRSGRVRTSHYVKYLTEFEENHYDSYVPPPTSLHTYVPGIGLSGMSKLWNDIKSERFVRTPSAVFHAQIQYNYNYTEFQREHARMLAIMDSLGINLNPAIIWNAIPWSFVIDWVLGVSRWLDSNKLGNMDPKINILQYLWSISRKRTIISQATIAAWRKYNASDKTIPLSIVRPVVNESSYRRVVGLPTASSIISSGLSSTEFSLGAALVLSRRRRPKRRH